FAPRRAARFRALASMSAVGTALGPSAGGLLIAWLDWRAMFLSTVPLSVLTLWLVHRHLPAPTPVSAARSGTSAEAAALWQGTALGAGLVMNALVATVMMATLVIGPFFLSGGLGLGTAGVGAAMSAGPLMSMVFGFVAGKLVDRWGATHTLRTGLLVMLAGALGLAVLPGPWGLAGYLLAISVLTPGYQLFQAANNTATLTRLPAARRGEVSGLLNLARNLGLMAGASVMGWVFAWVTTEPAAASPAILLHGVQVTFGAAAGLLMLSMLIGRTTRPATSGL
ncbi:MAG: MFS transporter, partial [Hydrogenophaga sp.]|nr:MFS transporter [Hydrogenophaga sp.]